MNSDSEQFRTTAPPKSVRSETLSGDHFSKFVLFTKDKLSDVREKLAIATHVKPYKQYIWVPDAHCSLTGDGTSLMHHWATSIRVTNGFPVDGYVSDAFLQQSVQTFVDNSVVILSMISLDSVIPDKSKLQFLARSDVESFELIHSNAIERFFPLVTLPIFNQYLMDEKEIELKYEAYTFSPKEAIAEFSHRESLLKELNKQPRVSLGETDLFSVSTLDIVMLSTYGDRNQRLDMFKLFKNINMVEFSDIGFIDLYTYDENRQSLRLRKLQQRDQFRISDIDPVSAINLLHTKNNLVLSRAIVMNLLPRSEYDNATLLFDKFGAVWLKFQPSQSHSFSKAAFIEFVASVIDPIIEKLNSYRRVFTSHERFAKVSEDSAYRILSSSSRVTLKFPVSFSKLLDILITKLMPSGFIEPWMDEKQKPKFVTSFALKSGVSDIGSGKESLINVKNVNGIASIELSNLDIEETNLYVDIIGRIILSNSTSLKAEPKAQTQLYVVDPVLFRPKKSFDAYSRICQKRFQPLPTTKDNPKSVEYYNYTFHRPEYYTCPSRENPILGFIQGKHEQGFCLPCCRKTVQPNANILKQSCINNELVGKQRPSTYKIEYPISDIANNKIMNRRIMMPSYVTELLGMKNIVANGTIISSHVDILNKNINEPNSHLQTANMICAIQTTKLVPLYNSIRSFIVDIISMIKQPLMQINIMKHSLVADRFVTPQILVHCIEDVFLKNVILDKHSQMSSTDWNDLIVFLGNCMGLNILLFADNRIQGENIQLTNLFDVEVTKPTLVLLKRVDTEWSSNSHNTRSLYLPITTSAYKVTYKTNLVIERLDISDMLSKIKAVVSDTTEKKISKQFTVENIKSFITNSRQYKLLDDVADQKLAVIGVRKEILVTSVSSMSTTVYPDVIAVKPSVSLVDVLVFIENYNAFVADSVDIAQYKTYLRAALKMATPYQYMELPNFLLKVHKVIEYNGMIIGIVVNVCDSKQPVSSELMFFEPCSIKHACTQITKYTTKLNVLHEQLNAKGILVYPVEPNLNHDNMRVEWLIHPLEASKLHNVCKTNLKSAFNTGRYNNEIYRLYTNHIVQKWSFERSVSLESFVLKQVKALDAPPIAHTKIDTLIQNVISKFPHYDPAIIRIMIISQFEAIASIAKTNQDLINHFKISGVFNGFDIKNIHRFTRSELADKVALFNNTIILQTTTYPLFQSDKTISDQRDLFFKDGKLIVHKGILKDVTDMFISDLMNPFRRDYIINSKLIESTIEDIKPHFGEVIYILNIDKR